MKNYIKISIIFIFAISCSETPKSETVLNEKKKEQINKEKKTPKDTIIPEIRKYMLAYPDFIEKDSANYLIWKDGTKMIYDSGIEKIDYDQILNSPDLKNQLSIKYIKGENYSLPEINEDPGRIRFEPFFEKMYGQNAKEVSENLVTINWLPSSKNQKLRVTKINGVAEKIQAISNQLDKLEHLHQYLDNPGGTYNWRKISGTDRLSVHSFGIAIDINVNKSNYWRWAKQTEPLEYKNQIPIEIVIIFEKYGFIWGGKWYHYDTMHFEYRPELL